MKAMVSVDSNDSTYESSRTLGEYLLFHYGSEDEQFPWARGPKEALGFPLRSVDELMDVSSRVDSALDLGCAVGRSSFLLADRCTRVLGIDYSQVFISTAQSILENGCFAYSYQEEGIYWKKGMVRVDKRPENLTFEEGDACLLSSDLGCFDLVHAANLLCRLKDPVSLLDRLPGLIVPGGQLLLTTPFSWLEEFTPRENWLGDGKSCKRLKEILSESFDLEIERNLPFLIREHRRKFQYCVSLGMRWRRKSSP